MSFPKIDGSSSSPIHQTSTDTSTTSSGIQGQETKIAQTEINAEKKSRGLGEKLLHGGAKLLGLTWKAELKLAQPAITHSLKKELAASDRNKLTDEDNIVKLLNEDIDKLSNEDMEILNNLSNKEIDKLNEKQLTKLNTIQNKAEVRKFTPEEKQERYEIKESQGKKALSEQLGTDKRTTLDALGEFDFSNGFDFGPPDDPPINNPSSPRQNK